MNNISTNMKAHLLQQHFIFMPAYIQSSVSETRTGIRLSVTLYSIHFTYSAASLNRIPRNVWLSVSVYISIPVP